MARLRFVVPGICWLACLRRPALVVALTAGAVLTAIPAGAVCQVGAYSTTYTCTNTPGCATPTDGDCDGIADATESYLAEKFAPIFRHDSGETNFPSSAEWYLARTHMRFHHDGGCSDDQLYNLGCVTASRLCGVKHKVKSGTFSCNHTSTYRSSSLFYSSGDKFFLQIPNDANEQLTRIGDWTGASWKCYARVRHSLVWGGAWDIQYWLFYPYNSLSLGEHEGDWEHITVTVNKNETLRSIYYAAHDSEGERFVPGEFTTIGITHPVSYVADGSHANYPTADFTPRGLLPGDAHDGEGFEVDCRGLTENMGEDGAPLNANHWLRYAGHWGEIGTCCVGKLGLNGPYGPPFNTNNFWDSCEDCPSSASAGDCTPCYELLCETVQASYISHFSGPNCSGTEYYYTPYFNTDGVRRTWNGTGCVGAIRRTATVTSWKDSNGMCRTSWPAGNTLSDFVKVYRPCSPSNCNLNGICENCETPLYCPSDCSPTYTCPNGICEWEAGESAFVCPQDCQEL